MSELKGKIDFTLFVSANGANVNGDPLNTFSIFIVPSEAVPVTPHPL